MDAIIAATDTDIKQLFHIIKLALSRAVAACVPESEYDDVKRVAVTLQCTEDRVSITVSDTGRHIQDSAKVLLQQLSGAFIPGSHCIAEHSIGIRVTDLEESVIRVFAVKRDRGASKGIAVETLPVGPKAAGNAFSGSELTFCLTDDVSPEEAANVLQTVMESAAMVAPPLHLHLRLKGVPTLLPPPSLPPQNEAHDLSVAGSQSGGQQSELRSEGQESEQDLLDSTVVQARRNLSMRLDMEPLPPDFWPDQRLLTGLRAIFAPPSDSSHIPADVDLIPGLDPAADTGVADPTTATQLFLGKSGSDYDGAFEQSVLLQRSKWTAQAVVALGPEPEEIGDDQPRVARVFFFRNWAPLAGEAPHLLKALSSCSWAQYGLLVASLSVLEDGSVSLEFALQSDGLAGQMQALVIHLYLPPLPLRKFAQMSPSLEAKMVRSGVEDALRSMKRQHPGALHSKIERRMQHALPYLAKTLAGTIASCCNPDLQMLACESVQCEPADLHNALLCRLQTVAGKAIYGDAEVDHDIRHISYGIQQTQPNGSSNTLGHMPEGSAMNM